MSPPEPFVVHRSHRVEDLADRLCELLATPSADPFARDAVVVHGAGLERWLTMHLAQEHGICANVDFVSSDELVARALRAGLGDDVDAEGWGADRLAWSILAALPGLLDDPRFAPVVGFLQADRAPGDSRPPDLGGRRAVSLARELGDLFARYAVYRPDLVTAWVAGSEDAPDGDWQPVLWRALAEALPGQDLARLHARFVASTAEGGPRPGLPARIAVFSVATLPPSTVDFLGALGRLVPVHVLALAPSQVAWDRVRERVRARAVSPDLPPLPVPRHPMLASMGTLAHDFAGALARSGAGEAKSGSLPLPDPDTLLRALQRDMLTDQLPASPPVLPPEDLTVQMHACHTALRQVQVLRHALLDLFDRLSDLEPRDVVVMAPEIDAFAPLVHTVFGDGEADWGRRDRHPGGLPRIPYSVADSSVSAENPVAAALLAALELVEGRLPASGVLGLLDLEVVRRRFGITPDDLPWARETVIRSGARWGADAAHRRDGFDQPDTDLYTWRHALDRLLLGQAMGDGDALVLGELPHGDVEGRDRRAILGGLVELAEVLIAAWRELRDPRPMDQWAAGLAGLAEQITLPEPRDTWQLTAVRNGLQELADHARDAGATVPVTRAGVETLVRGRFTVSEPGRGFLAGGITFCRLTPMRSIPFRVVCLLGMDDDAFPRAGTPLAIDRIDAAPRPGDRSPREDDRALFLESVLSARDALIVTWTGRSPLSDRVLEPATPVAELRDVLGATARRADGVSWSDAVVRRHALHAFGPAEVVEESFSYDRRDAVAANAWLEGRRSAVLRPPLVGEPLAPLDLDAIEEGRPEPGATLAITALTRFLDSPVMDFCGAVLGLWGEDEETALADREPTSPPGGLRAWELRDRLVRVALRGEALTVTGDAFERLRRDSVLPLGTLGQETFRSFAEEAEGIADRFRAASAGDEAPARVLGVSVRSTRVTGRIGGFRTPDLRVVWRAGRAREKYVLRHWVEHLTACADGFAGASTLVALDGEVTFSAVPSDAAEDHLADLVLLHQVGRLVPLLFFPGPSYTFAAAKASGRDPDVVRLWKDLKDYDHPLLDRVIDSNPFEEGFTSPLTPDPRLGARALARRIWGPALGWQAVEEDDA